MKKELMTKAIKDGKKEFGKLSDSMKKVAESKLEIKEISKRTGLHISTVEHTILSKGLKILWNENGKRVTDFEKFVEARAGMKAGAKTKEKRLFIFDWNKLRSEVKTAGLTMTEYIRQSGIKRNRFYCILRGVVYPTADEIQRLNKSII